MEALHSLLAGIVDYAGLFPPTGASMPDAAAEFARQQESAESWMLGAFVVPAGRLDELAEAAPTASRAWPLSVLVGSAGQLADVLAFLERHPDRFTLVALEWKPAGPDEIESFLAQAPQVEVFCELPWHEDPAPWVAALKPTRALAKLRCGGVTPDLIPPVDRVAVVLQACIGAGVGMKFTAGLHHPVRSEHPLTYQPDAPRAIMHGFLNVFVAAFFVAGGEADDALVHGVLTETDPAAFTVTSDRVRWREHEVSGDLLATARSRFARSFGSCSFAEPVEDLHQLGIL